MSQPEPPDGPAPPLPERRRRRVGWIAVVAALVVIAGAVPVALAYRSADRTAQPADPSSATRAEALIGSWQLTGLELDGNPIELPAAERSTLRFDEAGQAAGGLYCNAAGGRYEVDGDQLRIALGRTEIGCTGAAATAEDALTGLFDDPQVRFSIDGNELTISSDSGAARYLRLLAEPSDAVVGSWQLTGAMVDGTPVLLPEGGGAPTVSFSADPRQAGFSYCADYIGDYAVTGQRLRIGGLRPANELSCSLDTGNGQGAMSAGQDRLAGALGDRDLTISIPSDGDRLTLADAEWTLDFRRVPDALIGTWTLARAVVDDEEVALSTDQRATLTLGANGYLGYGDYCNGHGGRYVVESDELSAVGVISTAVACAISIGPLGRAFDDLFGSAELHFSATGDELTLSTVSTTFSYVRQAEVPVAELVGRHWVLQSASDADGPVPVTAPASLDFDANGALAIATGCQEFVLGWSTQGGGDTVRTSGAAYQEAECPSAVVDQDAAIIQLLDAGFQVQLDGDTLTIGNPYAEGFPRTFVFRAAS